MGSKLSFLSSAAAAAVDDYENHSDSILKVMIVTRDGSLREYSPGVTATDVVGGGAALCNSDNIFYDEFPPAIAPAEKLMAGQLYFLLEAAELRRRVTGADMVAMAGRASRALQGRRVIRPKVMVVAGGLPEKKKIMMKKKYGLSSGGRVGKLRRKLSTVHEINEELEHV